MDALELIRDAMNRFDENMQNIREDVQSLAVKFISLENALHQHVKDEESLTKKAATIVIAAIAIVGTIGFGSLIMYAPDILKLLNH